MNNIEQIMDFLDGNWDPETEQSFAARFSGEPELRSEFRNYIMISGEVSKNIKSFGPPQHATESVFDTLGFSLMSESESATQMPKAGFFRSKLFSSLMTGVVSAIVTYLIMLNYNSGKIELNHANYVNQNNVQNSANIPKVSSSATDLKNQKENTPAERPIMKRSRTENVKVIILHDTVYSDKVQSLGIQAPVSAEIAFSNTPAFHVLNMGGRSEPSNMQPILLSNDKNLGITFEFNNSTNWNFPVETITPKSLSKFNNMNLAILYDLDKYFRTGIQIDQETFYLIYQGTESDDITYQYRQQPNFTTYSILFRYYPVEFYQIKPFAGAGFGINSGGYVSRFSAGFEYMPYDNFSFLLSGEYANLWFNHQGSSFAASKASLRYGLSYHF